VFGEGSVAVTSNTSNPWWEVVFSGNYVVRSIDVYTCTNCADAAVAVEWLSRWNVYRHSLLRIRLTSFGHARSISTGC
jgi:hypothetical protein